MLAEDVKAWFIPSVITTDGAITLIEQPPNSSDYNETEVIKPKPKPDC